MTTSDLSQRIGRAAPTYGDDVVEIWLVPNPYVSSEDAVAVELRIVGARGGVKGRVLMADYGSSTIIEALSDAMLAAS
jgi:hypothetical protein